MAFDSWYTSFVDSVLDLVSTDLPSIMALSSLLVDKEEPGMLDRAAVDKGVVKKKARTSSISAGPLVTPSLDIFLASTYFRVLAAATAAAIMGLLNQNKGNMSWSKASDKNFENTRWRVFNRLCSVACEVPGRVMDIIAPGVTLAAASGGSARKSMEDCNLVRIKLKSGARAAWRRLLDPFTASIANPVSWHVCQRMKLHSFFFDRIDHDHAAALLPRTNGYKGPPDAKPRGSKTELYGSKAPPFLRAAEDPNKLIASAESVCTLLNIHSPLLALCSTEKEMGGTATANEEEEVRERKVTEANDGAKDANTYVHTEPF